MRPRSGFHGRGRGHPSRYPNMFEGQPMFKNRHGHNQDFNQILEWIPPFQQQQEPEGQVFWEDFPLTEGNQFQTQFDHGRQQSFSDWNQPPQSLFNDSDDDYYNRGQPNLYSFNGWNSPNRNPSLSRPEFQQQIQWEPPVSRNPPEPGFSPRQNPRPHFTRKKGFAPKKPNFQLQKVNISPPRGKRPPPHSGANKKPPLLSQAKTPESRQCQSQDSKIGPKTTTKKNVQNENPKTKDIEPMARAKKSPEKSVEILANQNPNEVVVQCSIPTPAPAPISPTKGDPKSAAVAVTSTDTQKSGSYIFLEKVTHLNEEFGYAGLDIFFPTSVVAGGGNLAVGDQIFGEAESVEGLPFKWKCRRVQKAIDPACQAQGDSSNSDPSPSLSQTIDILVPVVPVSSESSIKFSPTWTPAKHLKRRSQIIYQKRKRGIAKSSTRGPRRQTLKHRTPAQQKFESFDVRKAKLVSRKKKQNSDCNLKTKAKFGKRTKKNPIPNLESSGTAKKRKAQKRKKPVLQSEKSEESELPVENQESNERQVIEVKEICIIPEKSELPDKHQACSEDEVVKVEIKEICIIPKKFELPVEHQASSEDEVVEVEVKEICTIAKKSELPVENQASNEDEVVKVKEICIIPICVQTSKNLTSENTVLKNAESDEASQDLKSEIPSCDLVVSPEAIIHNSEISPIIIATGNDVEVTTAITEKVDENAGQVLELHLEPVDKCDEVTQGIALAPNLDSGLKINFQIATTPPLQSVVRGKPKIDGKDNFQKNIIETAREEIQLREVLLRQTVEKSNVMVTITPSKKSQRITTITKPKNCPTIINFENQTTRIVSPDIIVKKNPNVVEYRSRNYNSEKADARAFKKEARNQNHYYQNRPRERDSYHTGHHAISRRHNRPRRSRENNQYLTRTVETRVSRNSTLAYKELEEGREKNHALIKLLEKEKQEVAAAAACRPWESTSGMAMGMIFDLDPNNSLHDLYQPEPGFPTISHSSPPDYPNDDFGGPNFVTTSYERSVQYEYQYEFESSGGGNGNGYPINDSNRYYSNNGYFDRDCPQEEMQTGQFPGGYEEGGNFEPDMQMQCPPTEYSHTGGGGGRGPIPKRCVFCGKYGHNASVCWHR